MQSKKGTVKTTFSNMADKPEPKVNVQQHDNPTRVSVGFGRFSDNNQRAQLRAGNNPQQPKPKGKHDLNLMGGSTSNVVENLRRRAFGTKNNSKVELKEKE